jgi:hypothetical protein
MMNVRKILDTTCDTGGGPVAGGCGADSGLTLLCSRCTICQERFPDRSAVANADRIHHGSGSSWPTMKDQLLIDFAISSWTAAPFSSPAARR